MLVMRFFYFYDLVFFIHQIFGLFFFLLLLLFPLGFRRLLLLLDLFDLLQLLDLSTAGEDAVEQMSYSCR